MAMLIANSVFASAKALSEAEQSKLENAFAEADRLGRNSKYSEAEKAYLDIFDTYDDDITRIKTCIKLSEMYLMTGNAEKTLHYTQLAHDIDAIRDNIDLLFRVNNLTASVYLSQNDLKKCKSILQKSEKHKDLVTDKESLAKFYYITGKYAFASNDFATGIRILNNATTQYNDNIITPEYGRVLLLISQMYQIKNDHPLALKNAEEALMIFKHQNFGVSQIDAYCAIGNIYLKKNDMDKAYEYFANAKKMSDSINVKRGIETASLALANWHLKKDDVSTAQEYMQTLSFERQENTNPDLWFNADIQFAEYYLNINALASALLYINKADSICKNTNSWSKLSTLNKIKGNLYLKKKDYKKSAEALQKAQLYADSLAYNLSLIDIDSLGMSQEMKRQSDMISMLEIANTEKATAIENNSSIINRQKSSITAMIGLFVICGILMFMLAWSFLQKTKDNHDLEETNKKIALQKEQIEIQKQNLLNYNHELERLSLIARETDNAIRIFDDEGNTTWVNVGYTKLYGYSLKDLMLDSTLGFSKENPLNIPHIIKTWNPEKKSIEREYQIVNKWGIKLWVQTTLSPIFDDDTLEISQIIAIDTNITSLKNAQQDILTMNEEIMASITYAKHIQESMLSPIENLTIYFPDSFVFYKPRAIVSGDFYWITEQSGRIIVACADSTGHGVPGAFLSMLGISFLSKIVNERGIIQPSIILNRLRMNIISHLHQTNKDISAGDGMDMSIISIDKRTGMMEFAGAMNPIYIVRNGHFIELKPDRMPVGYYDNEDRSFSSTKVEIKHDDQLYMFSDGYYDQFGGKDGLKMKTKKFKEILSQCALKSNEEQTKILENEFENWKGSFEQVDDILILGIQI